MELQELINKAIELKKGNKYPEALNLYNKALDILFAEASEYARKQKGSHMDSEESGEKIRKILPKHFDNAKIYLKHDKTVAIILNNMDVIYAENHDYESAKKLFEQAIELTPNEVDYPNPKVGLESLSKLLN